MNRERPQQRLTGIAPHRERSTRDLLSAAVLACTSVHTLFPRTRACRSSSCRSDEADVITIK